MNPPKGAKPFDLEAALRGEPVITRDGRKVLHIRKREDWEHNGKWPILAKVEDRCVTDEYSLNGSFLFDGKQPLDLFIAPKKVKHQAWVNLYPSGLAVAHSTQELAYKHAYAHLMECRLIEWEGEE